MRAGIHPRAALGLALITAVATAGSSLQIPAVLTLDEKALREYAGVYQWDSNAFTYLQLWNEFGTNQLVAFDESGEVRGCFRRLETASSQDPEQPSRSRWSRASSSPAMRRAASPR